MNRRFFRLFLISLVFLLGPYVIFIQKPPLPEYLKSYLGKDSSPFKQILEGIRPITLRVPILTYHYIENFDDPQNFLAIAIATRPVFFEEQLKFLKNNGYVAITLSELSSALEGKVHLPEKPVILTFDDGYRDFYTNAFPMLKKYNFKSLNYIIVNHIGRSGNLTEGMIRELLDSGLVEIGCHTLDHEYLPRNGLSEALRQIIDCKKELEERFGVEVFHFAYPGGYYNEAVVKMVEEAGFETAVSTQLGAEHTFASKYFLSRLRVGNLNAEVFARRLNAN